MKLHGGGSVSTISVDDWITAKVEEVFGALVKAATGTFTAYEDFINLPGSKFSPQNQVLPVGIRQIFLVGIGGSSLGTKAIYTALKSFGSATIHFIENVDKVYMDGLMQDCTDAVFVVVCKSGKTYEIRKNLDYLTSEKYRGVIRGENTYVVSVEGTETWEWGKKLDAKLFPMPQAVSGRFQVFSAVSVVPLELAGIATKSILEGAKAWAGGEIKPQVTAGARYHFYKAGLVNDVYFAFDARLRGLVEWYASITAESLGKDGIGITPITGLGSGDDHAELQLYLQGPRDKFTTFISLTSTDADNLKALDAVKKAYDAVKLPYSHVELDAKNVEALGFDLGFFMQTKIVETVLLAELMGVNPYDQPGVELYKKYLQD